MFWIIANMAGQGNDRQPTLLTPRGRVQLTARQAEVLHLAGGGLSSKQIARFLGLSVRTIEGYFGAMRQRTGVRSLGELIAYGTVAGLIEPGHPVPEGTTLKSYPLLGDMTGGTGMARDSKTRLRLRTLCDWLGGEHQITADVVHEQDASKRWQWWLRWYDGPRSLPSTSTKSEELGIDTRHLYRARIITTRALAIQAARIALAGDSLMHSDVGQLARRIRAAADGTDWPERPASTQEAVAAERLTMLLRNAPGTDPALALATSVLHPKPRSGDCAPGCPPPVDMPGAGETVASGPEPTDMLDQLARIRAQAERGELELIEQARSAGATWQQIAAALGMRSRTSAQKRHADLCHRHPHPAPGTPGPHAAGTGGGETADQLPEV